MSSSSSDSDSDDLEPIRRIRINIKPKDNVKRDGADVDAIKASVEAWRPLCPRSHHTLTRRQSSLSSVSSLSFGTGSVRAGSGSSTAATTTSSTTANYNHNDYENDHHHQPGSGGGSTPIAAPIRGNTSTQHFMRSSPSCSSLVNEFNNRSSFSNFMPNASRTSSPLTFMNNYGDAVPIALAIQESIELTVKGQQGRDLSDTKFETRALGNIKIAFPNAFARSCSNGHRPSSALKLRLHSTENILRYYASGLVKDLGSETSSLNESVNLFNRDTAGNSDSGDLNEDRSKDQFADLLSMDESPKATKSKTKIIEFDMDALLNQLKQLYDQSPNARYFNVDVLRYQIAPIERFEKCPIQVCAYWRIEPKLVKLRIDFKHSSQCGLSLERLRELVFTADFNNLVPQDLTVNSLPPDAFSTLRSHKNDNNNLETFRNLSTSSDSGGLSSDNSNEHHPRSEHNNHHQYIKLVDASDVASHQALSNQMLQNQLNHQQQHQSSDLQIKLPPPPSRGHSRLSNSVSRQPNNLNPLTVLPVLDSASMRQQQPIPLERARSGAKAISDLLPMFSTPPNHDSVATNSSESTSTVDTRDATNSRDNASTANENLSSCVPLSTVATNNPAIPYITYEPKAHWNQQTRQLTWRFDNLLAYYKNDGYGSLLAKLDFRNCPDQQKPLLLEQQQQNITPRPIDIKFMVVDSTISKISMSIDSAGYRMSLLKREIRSGRYKSEPFIF